MRLSCNGCRILRRGCTQSCSIRPCLQWIKTSESQANATFFLAKFYGRAGLLNLINAGPLHLRPEIFKSLLYEACGRIVNPVCGSTGLLLAGSWHLCEAAVDAVLKGEPITPVSRELAAGPMGALLKACDIRHVLNRESSAACDRLHKVQSRRRFKRSAAKPNLKVKVDSESDQLGTESTARGKSASHGSVASRQPSWGAESGEEDSSSVETVEASFAEPKPNGQSGVRELELELTLGFRTCKSEEIDRWDGAACHVDIGC